MSVGSSIHLLSANDYNRVLTEDEIQQDMEQVLSVSPLDKATTTWGLLKKLRDSCLSSKMEVLTEETDMSDIRLAHPDDAEAIHLILQETWKDSLLFDVFMDHILSPEHQVFVAVDDGKIVGFLSAFLVPNPSPRWEIDLIIVRATSRGKGIGTSLIEEALTYGSNLGVLWAKASIRIDNYTSQRAFSNVGFTTDTQVGSIFSWDPLVCKSATNVPESIHFIPIDTLTYRGLWIEGFIEAQLSVKEQHNVIRAARNSIFLEHHISTGVFILDSLKQTIAPDLLTAATDFGQYHRWQYALR